jgi:putative membrane protein
VLWIKSLHVISIIAWMAALLYLPRLLVYHAASAPGSDKAQTFKIMERRLLVAIATPAMVASWVFGAWTATLIGAWSETWLWAKLACVAALTVFHVLVARWVKDFSADRNRRGAGFFRAVNELPTLLMVVIVIIVIVKPF